MKAELYLGCIRDTVELHLGYILYTMGATAAVNRGVLDFLINVYAYCFSTAGVPIVVDVGVCGVIHVSAVLPGTE